jgi:hypothetical protein
MSDRETRLSAADDEGVEMLLLELEMTVDAHVRSLLVDVSCRDDARTWREG